MPFAASAALAGARPLVSTAWGSDVYDAGFRRRQEIRLALRRSAVAMADSADLILRLRELGPHSLRTMLVNWGVDVDLVRPPTDQERAEAKARLGLGPGPVVFSPRGIKEVYNPGVVVEAFARVRATIPIAQLVLKHLGEEVPDQWRSVPGVRVFGRVEAAEMVELFRVADVTVSIPRSDSSPRSVWEAMAAGSATVLSSLPWVSELIVDKRDALVVQVDAGEVALAIERLLIDHDLRTRLVGSARNLVERHRNRRTELDRLEGCYRELVEARSGG
jgi:glycosyltransferase involved in cell wall biosynthesis